MLLDLNSFMENRFIVKSREFQSSSTMFITVLFGDVLIRGWAGEASL